MSKRTEFEKEFYIFDKAHGYEITVSGGNFTGSVSGEDIGNKLWNYHVSQINSILEELKMYKVGYIQHMQSKRAYDEGNGYNRAVDESNSKREGIKKRYE